MLNENDLYWLAGFLEGEGSFMKGPPSNPNLPVISAISTDEDVIKKISKLWNVKYHKYNSLKYINKGYKPTYSIRMKGKRAVELMGELKSLMGRRRQEQIKKAINSYDIKGKRLYEDIVINIKNRLKEKNKHKDIAKEFNISRETVVRINTGKVWSHIAI